MTDIESQLRGKYSNLIDRHQNLLARAKEREDEKYPTHSPEETRAEADGVMKGIQAIEEILNEIESNDE